MQRCRRTRPAYSASIEQVVGTESGVEASKYGAGPSSGRHDARSVRVTTIDNNQGSRDENGREVCYRRCHRPGGGFGTTVTASAGLDSETVAAHCFPSPKDGHCITPPSNVSWDECEMVRHAASDWYCREVAPGHYTLTPR